MSRIGTYSCFNETWIKDNYANYETNKALWKAYVNTFGNDNNYNSFRAYLIQLGLRREWTSEMTEFLRDKYAEWGAKKSQEELRKKFGVLKSIHCIHHHMSEEKIAASKEVTVDLIKKHHADSAISFPVGTIRFHRIDGSDKNKSRLRPMVRTETGWRTYGKSLQDKEDCVAVPLDHNLENLSPDNWVVIPKKLVGTMGKLNLWFDDPELTKVGIMLCELLQAMKQQERTMNNGRTV